MDWPLAIARNLAALRQIAATLVALAGLDPKQPSATLPRHLHTAVLAILRPAEAALRRLIVMAARDIVVPLSPAERDRLTQAGPRAPASRTGMFWNGRPLHPDDLARLGRDASRDPDAASGSGLAADIAQGPVAAVAKPRPPSFSLFDPLKRFGADRQGPSRFIPRILFSLDSAPALPDRRPASPNDPINAAQLCRRLAALRTALDDLPGQAQRLARWRARRMFRRSGRLSPLRPGSPPGHRQRGTHPVDDLLHHCHGLAIDVVMRNDTS